MNDHMPNDPTRKLLQAMSGDNTRPAARLVEPVVEASPSPVAAVKLEQKNRRVGYLAAGLVVAMVSLAYASVPLYDLFCKVTGFGGTTQIAEKAPLTAKSVVMTVRFDANTSSELNWTFQPSQQAQSVRIGEQTLAHYDARNASSEEKTGTAVFNVTPVSAGAYFNKLECFCFTAQTLKPGQRVSMPVSYFIDPAILDDPDTKNIREITLSYTFYPGKKPDNQANAAN